LSKGQLGSGPFDALPTPFPTRSFLYGNCRARPQSIVFLSANAFPPGELGYWAKPRAPFLPRENRAGQLFAVGHTQPLRGAARLAAWGTTLGERQPSASNASSAVTQAASLIADAVALVEKWNADLEQRKKAEYGYTDRARLPQFDDMQARLDRIEQARQPLRTVGTALRA